MIKVKTHFLQCGGDSRRLSLWSAVFCLLLFAAHICACFGDENPSEPDAALFGKVISEISYSSDLPLNRSHYDSRLGIKTGDILTRTAVKKAIQSLHESGRFSQIVVDAASGSDGVNICFRLRHNYYFNRFTLEGDVDLGQRSLWEILELPVGQRFTPDRLEKARLEVLEFMRRRGFYLAQVTARTHADEKTRQVDTVFAVKTGVRASVRSVEIKGVPPGREHELRKKFGFREGAKYDRIRLNARMESLRKYFTDKGYLAAVAEVTESFEPESNTVALVLNVSNFGRVRVLVDGYRIDQNQLQRLLPILTGEGINPEILDEGLTNLKNYLEDRGHSEASVRIEEKLENSGVRIFRYVIVPGRRFTVSYVRFKGNRILDSRELLASLQIQPSSPYSVSLLASDLETLRSLYRTRGYLQAEVVPQLEPETKGSKIGIVYVCTEGELSTLKSLTISGNEALGAKELLSKIRLAPGRPYSPSLVEQDRQSLLAAYNDLGYLQTEVSVRIGQPESNAYPVDYNIKEGPRTFVDRILVLGNDTTRPSIISKKIRLKENEPLSLGKLLQTQQSLYSMGVFDQVRVAPQNPESTTPHQNVVVRLQESRRFTIRYGLGYQEREKLRGTLEFSHLNIFGSARRADLRIRGSSIEQQAILSLQQPQFRAIPVDSYLTFSALQRRDVSFDSRRLNASYQFSHPFGSHSWGMLRYNFKNVRIFSTPLQPSELGREDQPVNLSTFSAAYINDTRDDYLDPSTGFFSSTDFGVTPKMWGDHQYLSFFSQNSYYRPLPKSFLMAFSVRFGAAHPFGGTPDLPISERFFAGGSSSLRGFDTDYAGPLDSVSNKPVGGNALFIGSFEMRIPLFRFVRLAGFYDGGNVFREIGDIRLSGLSHTLGAGLRIKTPFGPLRADYGYNLNLPTDLRHRGLTRGHFFITIGPPF